MSKVVVEIVLLDEDDPALKDFGDGAEATELTPRQIFDQIKEIDPNDLDDLQELIYNHLWGEGGSFVETGRTK
jgi:hypothetical protein